MSTSSRRDQEPSTDRLDSMGPNEARAAGIITSPHMSPSAMVPQTKMKKMRKSAERDAAMKSVPVRRRDGGRFWRGGVGAAVSGSVHGRRRAGRR
jgi:hypothetical protein